MSPCCSKVSSPGWLRCTKVSSPRKWRKCIKSGKKGTISAQKWQKSTVSVQEGRRWDTWGGHDDTRGGRKDIRRWCRAGSSCIPDLHPVCRQSPSFRHGWSPVRCTQVLSCARPSVSFITFLPLSPGGWEGFPEEEKDTFCPLCAEMTLLSLFLPRAGGNTRVRRDSDLQGPRPPFNTVTNDIAWIPLPAGLMEEHSLCRVSVAFLS